MANAEDVEKLIATAKDAGLRFTNLRHFDTGICSSIVAKTWTFQWQIKFLEYSFGERSVEKRLRIPLRSLLHTLTYRLNNRVIPMCKACVH